MTLLKRFIERSADDLALFGMRFSDNASWEHSQLPEPLINQWLTKHRKTWSSVQTVLVPAPVALKMISEKKLNFDHFNQATFYFKFAAATARKKINVKLILLSGCTMANHPIRLGIYPTEPNVTDTPTFIKLNDGWHELSE